MSTSEGVRELRKEYEQTQQAFATMLGISIASVAHYECNNRTPDYRVTAKLLHAAQAKRRKDLTNFFKSRLRALA